MTSVNLLILSCSCVLKKSTLHGFCLVHSISQHLITVISIQKLKKKTANQTSISPTTLLFYRIKKKNDLCNNYSIFVNSNHVSFLVVVINVFLEKFVELWSTQNTAPRVTLRG